MSNRPSYVKSEEYGAPLTRGKPLEEYRDNIQNGIWFMLHTMAEAAATKPLMEAYAHTFRNVCSRMGCSCENHCIEMLESNPPEKYFHIVDEDRVPIGCLYHSIDCHNMVNKRLGKPELLRSDVVAVYRPKVFAPCTDKSKSTSVTTIANPVVPGRRGGLTGSALAKKYPNLTQKKVSYPRTFTFIS